MKTELIENHRNLIPLLCHLSNRIARFSFIQIHEDAISEQIRTRAE